MHLLISLLIFKGLILLLIGGVNYKPIKAKFNLILLRIKYLNYILNKY